MITRAIRTGLARLGLGDWGESCPGGPPVPEEHRCAAAECDSVPLTTLRPGESGTVTCLDRPEHASTFKLAALGVLPGTRLDLVQRWPGYVFRVGYAELAVDAELAARVRVRRD